MLQHGVTCLFDCTALTKVATLYNFIRDCSRVSVLLEDETDMLDGIGFQDSGSRARAERR